MSNKRIQELERQLKEKTTELDLQRAETNLWKRKAQAEL